MAAERYVFLDEVGVQNLSTAILNKVNTRINERIVTQMTATVTDSQVMSAKAIKDLLGWSAEQTESVADQIDDINEEIASIKANVSSLTHLEYETFVGPVESLIGTAEEPNLEKDPQKIYLQKDSEEDPTWVMYAFLPSAWSEPEDDEPAVPTAGQWIVIGDTSIDLVNYWSKSEDSVAELRDALKIHDAEALTASVITAAVENAFLMTETFNPTKVALTIGSGVKAINYGNPIVAGQVPMGVKVTFVPDGLEEDAEYTYNWTVILGDPDDEPTTQNYETETIEVTMTQQTKVELEATKVEPEEEEEKGVD